MPQVLIHNLNIFLRIIFSFAFCVNEEKKEESEWNANQDENEAQQNIINKVDIRKFTFGGRRGRKIHTFFLSHCEQCSRGNVHQCHEH